MYGKALVEQLDSIIINGEAINNRYAGEIINEANNPRGTYGEEYE